MRDKNTKYTVEHEVTRNVFFQGTFEKCKQWLISRPDWEQYLIIDPVNNSPTGFTINRKMYEKRTKSTS